MIFDTDFLQSAHTHCTRNRVEIQQSEICGCFYCLGTFPPKAVERWLSDEGTALCAECQIDSVIGDASGLPVADPEFLKAMNQVWFSPVSGSQS